MKTLAEINALLSSFQSKYGIDLRNAPQGSAEWLVGKLGVPSASNASKLLAKPGSDTRSTYMAELVAQVATGVVEELNAKALDWGKQHEDAARSSYEFATGEIVEEVPFVFKDDTFRVGCSPDGILSVPKGLELKCPYNSVHYVKFVVEEKIKPEWQAQNQFTMWVTGAEEWDFGQFDPRMKVKSLHYVTIERDEKVQKTLDDAVPQFLHEMDQMLAKLGIKFGDQWLRVKAAA